jgi:sulfur-oxidizing protein SoxY
VDECALLRSAARAGRRRVLTRRAAMRTLGAGAVAWGAWAVLPASAAATTVREALDRLLAGRTPVQSARVRLDLPERYDYGNTVPLAVAVDSPMTGADHVRRVDVFAAGNPFPEVATFHFTPDSGRASSATRIRLNEGAQEVVAVAELSDGSAWVGRRTVEVAISGCSAEAGVEVGYAMPTPEPRLKVPAQVSRGEIVEIKTMISHRMETGLRIDVAGNPIPRRIINRMSCSCDGRLIFAADLSPAIAANAYLSFPMVARASGVLEFAWREDGGAVYRAVHSFAAV